MGGACSTSSSTKVSQPQVQPPAPVEKPAEKPVAEEPRKPKDLSFVFHQLDTNHDGTLDRKELKRALRALGLGCDDPYSVSTLNLDDLMEHFTSGDGSDMILLDEWDAFMPEALRDAIESKMNDQDLIDGFRPLVDLAKVFDQFDTDGSGDLTFKEIKRALTCLGLKDQAEEMMANLDENQDGVISLEEWKTHLTKDMLYTMSCKLDQRGLIKGFVDDGRERKKL